MRFRFAMVSSTAWSRPLRSVQRHWHCRQHRAARTRLADLQSRSRRHALFAADADQYDEMSQISNRCGRTGYGPEAGVRRLRLPAPPARARCFRKSRLSL
jgi:hypothetical protein